MPGTVTSIPAIFRKECEEGVGSAKQKAAVPYNEIEYYLLRRVLFAPQVPLLVF